MPSSYASAAHLVGCQRYYAFDLFICLCVCSWAEAFPTGLSLTYRFLVCFLAFEICNSKQLAVVCAQNAHEFSDLPVRHNEDHVNSELAAKLPLSVDPHTYDNSNTKTHLLLQAHFGRVPLPASDYHTDTKSVMDQVLRVLQVCHCAALPVIIISD